MIQTTITIACDDCKAVSVRFSPSPHQLFNEAAKLGWTFEAAKEMRATCPDCNLRRQIGKGKKA